MNKQPAMTCVERKARRAAIARAVLKGKDAYETACAFGVSYSFVLNACYEHGVTVNGKRQPQTKASVYAIIRALFGEESMEAIALRHNVSRQRVQQVYQNCVAAGIPVQKRSRQIRY